VGTRADLDGRKISSPPGFDPGRPARSSVAIPTKLPDPYFHRVYLQNKLVIQNKVNHYTEVV